MDRKRQKLNPEKVSVGSPGTMADSCCIAELKETIEKMNAELIQSHTKISELNAKVREQEEGLSAAQKEMSNLQEENAKLTRSLKESEEKCRAVQERLELAEQRLAQFSQKADATAEESLAQSEEKCWVVQERLDLAEKKLAQFSEKPVTDAEECLAQISFPLVEKDGNSGVVKYDSNIKHLLKRKKLHEETKENNVKTIKLTSILKGGSATKKKLKLSKKKEKSYSSNPHLICNKEVVIRLERLNDSTVAEMTACGSALPPEQVNESNDDAVGINSLPDEIIEEIFGYFTQNQLGQIARVCRRWNVLTKSPVLWRKVNVKIFSSDTEKSTITKSFINGLPSCVTFIRLEFPEFVSLDFSELDFEELCAKLNQNCPHVEELILACCVISNILPEVINFCTEFLLCVKKLVFHNCSFYDSSRRVELSDNSKIEVLDLYGCVFFQSNKTQFSKLLHLRELRLSHTDVDDTWFEDDTSFLNQLHVLDLGWTSVALSTLLAIQRHGHNLKELYLCKCSLWYHDLNFNNSIFRHLKTICLCCNYVKCKGVVSLIQSCPSLENVYVDEAVAVSFAAHPFVVANRCKSGIVKSIVWSHNHKVDYSHT